MKNIMGKIILWLLFSLAILVVLTYIAFFLWSAIGGADAPKGVHFFFPWLPTE